MLIGNVGQNPDVRYLDNQQAKVASFRMATTERYTDRSGQPKEETEWHNIVLFRNLGEWAERYIRKGMKIYVEGKIQTRSWEKDGQMRHKTEIVGENVQVLYRPEYLIQEQRQQREAQQRAEQQSAYPTSEQDSAVAEENDNIF